MALVGQTPSTLSRFRVIHVMNAFDNNPAPPATATRGNVIVGASVDGQGENKGKTKPPALAARHGRTRT